MHQCFPQVLRVMLKTEDKSESIQHISEDLETDNAMKNNV